MCGFVRAQMLLAIVRYNNLLLRGAREKEAYTQHISDLADAVVMVLIAPQRD